MNALLAAIQAHADACETVGRAIGEAEHDDCKACARRIRDARVSRGKTAVNLLLALQNSGLSIDPETAERALLQEVSSSGVSGEAPARVAQFGVLTPNNVSAYQQQKG